MPTDELFLKPNVVIEPLIDRFYAWMLSVAPVQGALNLAGRHVPLLESYVQSPSLHVAASTNPELRGGHFVAIPTRRADEVQSLLDSIKTERKDILKFADAIQRGHDLLHREAAGFDLTSVRNSLPDELAGKVEVAYDSANQPVLRFLEPSIYRSEIYSEDRQSVQLSLDDGVERPFVLSTPRLPSEKHLDLDIPFRHAGIDRLFESRLVPTTLAHLREALEIEDDNATKQLASLLTAAPALSPDRHITSGGRVRYLGHACLLMQTPDAAVITDPFLSSNTDAGNRFTYGDLPDVIDLCLITHGHQDHVVLESLLALRGRIKTVVVPRSSRGNLCDPSLGLFLRHLGFSVVEVDDYDEVEFPGGRVVATPFLGEHADLDIRAKSTFWVTMAGKTIFVGADSSGVDGRLYRDMRNHVGRPDIAFLGMECDGAPLTWLYQPLLMGTTAKTMSESRTLSGSDAEQAKTIVSELQAGEAHIYAMGLEEWLGHVMATSYTEDSYQLEQVDEFLRWCFSQGISSELLIQRREWRW